MHDEYDHLRESADAARLDAARWAETRLVGVRFEVRALMSGEGYVIVDTQWIEPMIGPWPLTKKGLEAARLRAVELETAADLGP